MLYLHVGPIDRRKIFGDKYFPWSSDYFDVRYKQEWFDDEFVKYIVKEIDDSDAIGGDVIKSPVLGTIPPRELSTGCKTLISIYKTDEYIFSGEKLGDNCWNVLFKICKDKDVTLPVYHYVLQEYIDEHLPECTIVNDYNRLCKGRDNFISMLSYVSFKQKVRWCYENNCIEAVYPDGIDDLECTIEEYLMEMDKAPGYKYWLNGY